MLWTRGILLVGLAALVVLPIGAQQKDLIPGQNIPGSVTPLPLNPDNLPSATKELALRTKLTEEQVDKVLAELGPLVAEKLARGQGFEIKGVGSFRVIRVVAHRALIGNVAVEVPARNTVQFEPSSAFGDRLNRPDAVPGVPVGEPDFNPQPGRVPGTRFEPGRIEPDRVPKIRRP